MTAHLKQHDLNSTADHAPGTNGTLLGTESNAVAEKAFGTSATGDAIVQRGASGQVTLPAADPVADTDAASKGYVDAQIVSGVTWKELVLAPEQLLNGASGGILQAILATLTANLTAADTFIVSDGATVETWTAVAGAPAAFQFQIGGSASATLTNLVAAINADSTLWSAVETSGLDAYFTGLGDPQLVIYRTAVPGGAANDRVYGTLAGSQGNIRVVEFATGDQDYREQSGSESDLPSGDPAAKRFGFGRAEASINTGDTHRVANDNTASTWDGDDQVWQQTSTSGATSEGDGIDVTGGKVSTDVSTATAEQQFGGLVNTRNADGSGAAAADAGHNAIQTDFGDLAVNASNQLAIKAGSRLDLMVAQSVWESETSPDKSPTLSELNSALGTAAGDIGNFGILVERSTALGQQLSAGGAGGVGSTSSFWALKVANAGALADYQLVEMS
jgi:hypothetical protein